MAKAIVKINAFLDAKQTKEVYNLIYDQVKAGLDVVMVPSYCDVYILNGADIEVQKNEKNEVPISKEQQFKINYDGKSAAEWFKHDMCTHCKHSYDDGCCGLGEPCSDFNRWEYKNE